MNLVAHREKRGARRGSVYDRGHTTATAIDATNNPTAGLSTSTPVRMARLPLGRGERQETYRDPPTSSAATADDGSASHSISRRRSMTRRKPSGRAAAGHRG